MGFEFSGELATEGDFDVLDDGIGRKVEDVSEVDAGFEFYIVDRSGGLIVKMAVLIEIRTIARRFAVEVHLADNLVLNKRLKTVVNGRQGDIGKGLFDAHEDLIRRGMGALPHQKTIDFLALPGHAQTVDLLRHFWVIMW